MTIYSTLGGCKRAKPDPRDYIYEKSHHYAIALTGPPWPVSTNKMYQTRYLAALPPHVQHVGDCVGESVASAVASVVLGLDPTRPVNLSGLFVYWNARVLEGTTAWDQGCEIPEGLKAAANWGVCAELMWPETLEGWDPVTGNSNYQQGMLAVTTKPTQPAFDDAVNRKIGQFLRVSYDGKEGNFLDLLRSNLALGFPVVFGHIDHAMCITDYDDSAGMVYGLNSMVGNAAMSMGYPTLSSGECFDFWTIRDVSVYGPPTLTPSYPANLPLTGSGPPPLPSPPPPPPTGNTQMLLDTIVADAQGLVLGQITQAQIDKLKADVGQLVPDASTAPPPPPPPSPPGLTTVPPAASITDNSGGTWTLDLKSSGSGGYSIMRNGGYGGGSAVKLSWDGTKLTSTSKGGQTYTWTGNGWQIQ